VSNPGVWHSPANRISEDAFVVAVSQLCPLDKKHTQNVKNGLACSRGVHSKGLTTKSVQRAKSIVACITESTDTQEPPMPEEINLEDPGFALSSIKPASAVDFEW